MTWTISNIFNMIITKAHDFKNHLSDFQVISFIIHATRGVIRDQGMRRWMMFAVLVVAMLMLAAGTTLLQDALDPHQHPTRFIFFWLVCAWLTISALLLAAFDVLMVRAQARAARRLLKEQFADSRRADPARDESE